MDTRELAWAAGLFEGEGYVQARPYTHPRSGRRLFAAMAVVGMADPEPLRRLHAAMGMGRMDGPYPNGFKKDGTPCLPQWRWSCSGFEKVQATAAMLWFGLSEHRKGQFRLAMERTRHRQLGRDPHNGRFVSVEVGPRAAPARQPVRH